jgi:hypothetical protein
MDNILKYVTKGAQKLINVIEPLTVEGFVKNSFNALLFGPQAIHTANVKRRPLSHWHAGRKFDEIKLNAPRIGSKLEVPANGMTKSLFVVGFFGKDANTPLNENLALHYGGVETAIFYGLLCSLAQVNLVLSDDLPTTKDHGSQHLQGVWDPLKPEYVKEKVVVMSMVEIKDKKIVWDPVARDIISYHKGKSKPTSKASIAEERKLWDTLKTSRRGRQ